MSSPPVWWGTAAQRKRVALVAVLLVFIIVILLSAWAALVPFFLGSVLAYLLMPLVNLLDQGAPRFLRRLRWSRPLAILVVYIAGLALIAGTIAYIVPVVRSQGKVFGEEVLPNYFERVQPILTFDFRGLMERIPPEVQATVNASLERAVGTLLTGVQKGIEVTFNTVSQTISFIIGLVIVPFWLFYVLNDAQRLRSDLLEMIPEQSREDVRCIAILMDSLLSSYVRGQLLLCLLVGMMSTIALVVLQVDLAMLLGTFAGVFEIIPILGPYLGAIPAVLIALLKRPILALWVTLAFIGIQWIENVFLVPRISGNAVRFHPALVMVIVVVGSQVAGLLGLLVAVPMAAMLRDVFRYLYLRTTERGFVPREALDLVLVRNRRDRYDHKA